MTADINEAATARAALQDRQFDVGVDWISYAPQDVESRIDVLDQHTLRVDLTATAFAYVAHLLASDPATRFSDNYDDVLPG